MNEIIFFTLLFLGLAYHVIFFWVSCQVQQAEWQGKRCNVSWFWTLRTKAKRTNAEGLKVPKTMLQENSPFLYFMDMCLSSFSFRHKKTFENVSRVCENEYKKISTHSFKEWMPISSDDLRFFTTNQFPKLRLHSGQRMQNYTSNLG